MNKKTKLVARDYYLNIIKIILPVSLTIILFLIAIYKIALPEIKEDYMKSKKEMAQELTRTAWHLLNDYESRVISGELTKREAQKRAVARIRQLRYGNDNKDYFWINDMHPRMIMHPYRTDLEGKDITDFEDPNGRHLFVDSVRVVKNQDAGFIMYMWQWQDNPDMIVPKLSYVMGFRPWGWIIGTGIYIEDIQERITAITDKLNKAFIVIFTCIAIISLFIIIQSILREKARRQAKYSLLQSEQLLRNIIEFLPDATLVINKNEQIIAWNKAMEKITGKSSSEMIGKGNYEYALPFYGKRRPLLINLIMNPDPEREKEYLFVKREETHLIAEAFTPAMGAGGRYVFGRAALLYDTQGNINGAIETIRDITDWKIAEEKLKESLQEKDILLKEIHHRVKNNLQIISSLLSLQTDYIGNKNDMNILNNCQTQILSMAVVHEKLYQTEHFSSINVSEFLHDLSAQLLSFYNRTDPPIDIVINVNDIVISIDIAIPLIMLINEIVTNSLKYAFSNGSGEIQINFYENNDNKYHLVVSDNGSGFNETEVNKNTRSFGLNLINTLVKQLHGTMSLNTDNGTCYEIEFSHSMKSRKVV